MPCVHNATQVSNIRRNKSQWKVETCVATCTRSLTSTVIISIQAFTIRLYLPRNIHHVEYQFILTLKLKIQHNF